MGIVKMASTYFEIAKFKDDMYSTDITDAQWDNIKNFLIGKTIKRKFCLRSV